MSYSTVILAEPSLQSYWRLGDASGSVTDNKGAVSGTNTAALYKYAGLLLNDTDTAMWFDGATSHIDFGDNYRFAGTATFSIEFWFSMARYTAALQVLIGKYISGQGGWQVTIDTGNGMQFPRFDAADAKDNVFAGQTFVTGVPYHVAATYDGSFMNLYINAVLPTGGTSPQASSRSILGGTGGLFVGEGSNTAAPFSGTIDEVAIYNAGLTRQQVQNHYVAGAAGGVRVSSGSVSSWVTRT